MLPRNLKELRERWRSGERFEFFLFYGHKPPEAGVDASCLSQWFAQGFDVDGVRYRTAEHWMMAEKARLFGDDEMLAEILESETPREAKALGRKVRNFDPDVWNEHKFEIVVRGNLAKFGQHAGLQKFLKGTRSQQAGSLLLAAESRAAYSVEAETSDEEAVREKRPAYDLGEANDVPGPILVEAAGRDCIWGIGLGRKNPKSLDPMQWRGQNLLGFALTEVRERLSASRR